VELDADLVHRAIARDPEAVRELVTSLAPVIQGRIAKALTRRPGPEGRDVEHLAQEVFLALFDHGGRALRAWKPERGLLGAFVAQIADHQVASILRSGKRRPWTDDLDLLTAPAATASHETLDALLDRLRADLSVRGFDLFTRLYVEERSVEAASAELGMSADAIDAWRSRLSKALAPLAAVGGAGTAGDKDDAALLKQLGARAREQRAEPVPAIPALDAEAEERIAGRLLERVRDSLTHQLAIPKPARAAAHPLRWLIAAVPLAAAAVALVLFVTTRGPSVVPLAPAYELSLVSVKGTRDPSSAKVGDADYVLDPSAELELVARPAAPVKDAHARAFLVRSGEVKPWLVPLQMSDEGAVRITGMTRVLFPTTSEPYDIVIFVAAGDVLPSDADAQVIASGAKPAPDAKYRVVRGHIRFAAGTPPTP
jgi:DNA-directed RNA polymerase specialized sigma24 family protein